MKTTTILCPATDRPVTVVLERVADSLRPLVRCLAPCTGRYCPSKLKTTQS